MHGGNDEINSQDSIANSHRRSRSQSKCLFSKIEIDVGGNSSKAKSERKNGGRTLMMKNRLVAGA
jgi:hypothetical protein